MAMRPLIFQCPDTNLSVITRIIKSAEMLRQADALPLLLDCPCGSRHRLTVKKGLVSFTRPVTMDLLPEVTLSGQVAASFEAGDAR